MPNLEEQLKQAKKLLKLLYVNGVDDSEGDCLYCGAEGYCYDDCIMLEVEQFLEIDVPDTMSGGPEKRYHYVTFKEDE